MYKQSGMTAAILDGMYRGRSGGIPGMVGGAALGAGVATGGEMLMEDETPKVPVPTPGTPPRTNKRPIQS